MRQDAGTVAADAELVAERFGDRGPQRNAGIFDRVMRVDFQVSCHTHGQVEQAVAREAVQHMVEETDPSRDVSLSGPVQIDTDLDVCFFRNSLN